jgi:hypothetical protein
MSQIGDFMAASLFSCCFSWSFACFDLLAAIQLLRGLEAISDAFAAEAHRANGACTLAIPMES